MTKPITLRLSTKQADWLFHELIGLVEDYTQRNILEPEDEAAVRQVIKEILLGRKLAQARFEQELDQLIDISHH